MKKLLEVKYVKVRENAIEPTYAHNDDAGMDLYASSKTFDEHGNVCYGTGIAVQVPKGYAAFIFPRSSNSKKALWLTNSVGIVDSGYTGEITLKYRPSVYLVSLKKLASRVRSFFFGRCKVDGENLSVTCFHDYNREYQVGDRIGQMVIMPYPKVHLNLVDKLDESERGANGYGSTGN